MEKEVGEKNHKKRELWLGKREHIGKPGHLRKIKALGTWGEVKTLTHREKESREMLGPLPQFPPHLWAETAEVSNRALWTDSPTH